MSTELAIDPAAVRRVLLIRPRFLGDLCLTLPTLDAVRAACPAATLAYVVEREAAPLLDGDPRVDDLIVAERHGGPAAALATAARIRSFAPDVALDLFCNPRTALWTFASGARVRVGYPNKGWRSALYTHHAHPRTLSAVGFHLASLGAIGWPVPEARVPRLHLGEPALREAADALRALGVPGDARLLGLHPGARWMTRRWKAERFAEIGRRFLEHERRGMVIVSGGPGEDPVVNAVSDALPAARTRRVIDWPIARFVAFQSKCAAFVCGDTGPLHSAVAAGAPTLALMSRNRPAMFFPYAGEALRACYARVECSPCHRDVCADLRCLERLTVDRVWRELEALLERAAAGAGIC